MAKPPGFSTHHKLAKAAFDKGDHSAAMHHVGKMLHHVKSALKGQTSLVAPSMDQDAGMEAAETPPPVQRGGLGNWMQQGKPSAPMSKPASPMDSKRAAFAKLRGH